MTITTPTDARELGQVQILNPASYTIDLHDVLPRDAEKIFARAA